MERMAEIVIKRINYRDSNKSSANRFVYPRPSEVRYQQRERVDEKGGWVCVCVWGGDSFVETQL